MLICSRHSGPKCFRHDRDAAFTFQIHSNPSRGRRPSRYHGACPIVQHRIDKSRLAMVNVSDDCDVAYFFSTDHSCNPRPKANEYND